MLGASLLVTCVTWESGLGNCSASSESPHLAQWRCPPQRQGVLVAGGKRQGLAGSGCCRECRAFCLCGAPGPHFCSPSPQVAGAVGAAQGA